MTDVAHDETSVKVSTSRHTAPKEVLDRRRYKQHLTAEGVAEHPEDLVADVGLQAVDGQHDPAGRGGRPAGAARCPSSESVSNSS